MFAIGYLAGMAFFTVGVLVGWLLRERWEHGEEH